MCDARSWNARAFDATPGQTKSAAVGGAAKRVRSIAGAPSRRRSGRVRIANGIRRLLFAMDLALDVRRERRMLLNMDDHALKDIGFSRSEAYAEARRPLWDIPRDRLLL
jgi:uncharacterized protein YjiS (DUF1127 family)